MIILALDTTTRAGSAAVLRDGVVLAELSGDPALTHGQRLPGELMRVLAQADVRIEDVDLFAVAAGPGSFTGLRVGIATVQGLAMARSRRVVPVSTLDALAWAAANAAGAAANADRRIAAWMDAQRGDVFAALYDAGRARHAHRAAIVGAGASSWIGGAARRTSRPRCSSETAPSDIARPSRAAWAPACW